jgi:hypothetical protein
MSDHRSLRATAFLAPARRRSFALALGAAAVALSLGASVALQWIESPSTRVTANVAVDVVPPQMAPTAAPSTIGPVAPKDHASPPNKELPTIRQTSPDHSGDPVVRVEPRAVAKSAPDLDVVPPAETPSKPAAAEAPTRADSAPAAVAAIAGAAAGGAALATAESRRVSGVKSQIVPLPRPPPPAETRAAAASMPVAKSDKDQGRRRTGASYSKRGPLKLIGMLFGGWRTRS